MTVIQLADYSGRHKSVEAEPGQLAAVIPLRPSTMPEQHADGSVEPTGAREIAWTESRVIATQALQKVVERQLSPEAVARRDIRRIISVLGHYADSLGRGGPDPSSDEQRFATNGRIEHILAVRIQVETRVRAMAEQGNSSAYTHKAIQFYLHNEHPDLYEIACGKRPPGAE